MFDPLNEGYGRVIGWMLRRKVIVLVGLGFCLIAGVVGVATSPKSFFPGSDRAQLIVYIDLPADVTANATNDALQQVLPTLTQDRFDWLKDQAAYVGFGGPRFVLSLTPIDPAPNRVVIVVNIDESDNVERAEQELRAHLEGSFGQFQARVTPMFLGPSVSSILEVQVKGPDHDFVYETARQIETIIGQVPGAHDIRQDWENRAARLTVRVDQARARAAGVTSADVASSMSAFYSGKFISEFRDGDDVIPIVARGVGSERDDLNRMRTLPVFGASGQSVPLMQVAELELVNGFAALNVKALHRDRAGPIKRNGG